MAYSPIKPVKYKPEASAITANLLSCSLTVKTSIIQKYTLLVIDGSVTLHQNIPTLKKVAMQVLVIIVAFRMLTGIPGICNTDLMVIWTTYTPAVCDDILLLMMKDLSVNSCFGGCK